MPSVLQNGPAHAKDHAVIYYKTYNVCLTILWGHCSFFKGRRIGTFALHQYIYM